MNQAIALLKLLGALSPIALKLIMAWAEEMQGKTDHEILSGADAKLDAVIAKAKRELGKS